MDFDGFTAAEVSYVTGLLGDSCPQNAHVTVCPVCKYVGVTQKTGYPTGASVLASLAWERCDGCEGIARRYPEVFAWVVRCMEERESWTLETKKTAAPTP